MEIRRRGSTGRSRGFHVMLQRGATAAPHTAVLGWPQTGPPLTSLAPGLLASRAAGLQLQQRLGGRPGLLLVRGAGRPHRVRALGQPAVGRCSSREGVVLPNTAPQGTGPFSGPARLSTQPGQGHALAHTHTHPPTQLLGDPPSLLLHRPTGGSVHPSSNSLAFAPSAAAKLQE